MGLNKSAGNMYEFVSHTWNVVKGKCPHDCSYCFMKRYGVQNPVRFDAGEMKTNLGESNFIFCGSSCDMFAYDIPDDWIRRTLAKAANTPNRFLLQSKNPERMARYKDQFAGEGRTYVCTTLETNRIYADVMRFSPLPHSRVLAMENDLRGLPRFLTVEPVMDFDLVPFVELIKRCEPMQVNVGADSDPNRNHLPEPPGEKVLELIERLKSFTTIAKKRNLGRLVGNG